MPFQCLIGIAIGIEHAGILFLCHFRSRLKQIKSMTLTLSGYCQQAASDKELNTCPDSVTGSRLADTLELLDILCTSHHHNDIARLQQGICLGVEHHLIIRLSDNDGNQVVLLSDARIHYRFIHQR